MLCAGGGNTLKREDHGAFGFESGPTFLFGAPEVMVPPLHRSRCGIGAEGDSPKIILTGNVLEGFGEMRRTIGIPISSEREFYRSATGRNPSEPADRFAPKQSPPVHSRA